MSIHTVKPFPLFDTLIDRFNMKNDAELSRVLRLAPPIISKVRNEVATLSAAHILRIHEQLGVSVAEIRALQKSHLAKSK